MAFVESPPAKDLVYMDIRETTSIRKYTDLCLYWFHCSSTFVVVLSCAQDKDLLRPFENNDSLRYRTDRNDTFRYRVDKNDTFRCRVDMNDTSDPFDEYDTLSFQIIKNAIFDIDWTRATLTI